MADLKTAQPLHRESIAYLEAEKKMNMVPLQNMGSVEAVRAIFEKMISTFGEIEYDGTRTEMIVPQPDVADGIPVWVYNPKGVVPKPPIIVYFHGGGNVIGSRKIVDTACKKLSSGTGGIVVSVEYRLAPEHKFPAGVNDSCGVTKWVMENRTALGGSVKSKVGVAGDSAGGQQAATVAHDVPGVAFEVLIYPFLNTSINNPGLSYQEYKNGPVLDAKLLEWFECQMSETSDRANPRLLNQLRTKFDHLPPTLFIIAECDPLRDDSYEYASKLHAAGVFSEVYLGKGALHGFYTMQGFDELCKEANGKVFDFIKRFGMSN